MGWTLALLAAPGAPAADSSGDPDRLYEQAIEAAVAGDAAERVRILRDILQADPDHEPTRAELGQIEVDGRWVPAEHAGRMAAYNPLLAAYGERLAAAEDTADDHRALAAWCEKEDLAPEARLHWLAVLNFEPNDREALAGLNAEWRDGWLWDRELAAEADERAEEREASAREWEKRFRRFERGRLDETQLVVIRDELDAGATEPIERRALAKTLSDSSRRLVEAFLDVSEGLPGVEVTASLCRIAISAADQSICQQATDALRSRPRADSMPLLLSQLIGTIESSSQIVRDANGNIVYVHAFRREGQDQAAEHVRTRVATARVVSGRTFGRDADPAAIASVAARSIADAQLQAVSRELEFRVEAANAERDVARYNRVAETTNRRVISTLSQVLDQPLGEDPNAWWNHWRDYTGYDRYAKPVERTYDFDEKDYYVEGPPVQRRCECFVAGTPVWTRTGPKAIETLEPGELVLARDPDRGGLVYRVVLDTTVRRPSPMIAVEAGGETIHATEGHPFWVLGRGWRMARELAVGDLLSTVEGPAEVTDAEAYEPNEAYNLVVEGAANYYVGDAGFLVHDNTPRRPAVGLIARR